MTSRIIIPRVGEGGELRRYPNVNTRILGVLFLASGPTPYLETGVRHVRVYMNNSDFLLFTYPPFVLQIQLLLVS